MKRIVAFLALFFTLIVLACCVLSIAFPWYIVTRTSLVDTNNKYKTLYYFDEIRITNDNLNFTNVINKGSSDEDATKYDDLGYDHIKNVFIVSLAFVCLATLLTVISAIVTLIAFIGKSKIAAKVSGVFMIIVMLLLLVGFFQFLRLPGAFREDDKLCYDKNVIVDKINDFFNGEDTYCHRFLDYSGNEDSLFKLSFGPFVGWWLACGGIFFSLFVFIPLFKTSS